MLCGQGLGVIYSGESYVCGATLSLYSHWASLKIWLTTAGMNRSSGLWTAGPMLCQCSTELCKLVCFSVEGRVCDISKLSLVLVIS